MQGSIWTYNEIIIRLITEARETEELFWKDMDLKEFDATVVSVEGNEVVLDRTAFFATGGGQPNDTGVISCSSVLARFSICRASSLVISFW